MDTQTKALVLVVDDDEPLAGLVARWLARDGFDAKICASGTACMEALATSLPDAVLLDQNMPGLSGQETLERIKDRHPNLPVIMMTGDTGVDAVVAAMQAGAYDYIPKPLNRTKVITSAGNAAERYRMEVRLKQLEREAHGEGFPGIVGESPPMKELFRQIDRVAPSPITVLIHGESGTGKELVARALHDGSGCATGPFVPLNCAAIPESLQESELFGHERGAFTGATAQRIGRFEQADGGTLFLDEVAELHLALQAKLLRVLQDKTFQRVGGGKDIRSSFRLLAATHRDLEEEVRQGRFREDLYYRIAVFELEVPPLRDRGGDLDRLIEFFLAGLAHAQRRGPARLSQRAREIVRGYAWPGNVRELEHALQRAFMLARNEILQPEDLPPRIVKGARAPASPASDNTSSDGSAPSPEDRPPPTRAPAAIDTVNLSELERIAIMRAMERANGNLSEVGRLLGIGRTTLYRKLKKYELR